MLSEVDLAAQHVVIMLAYINYMVCLDDLCLFLFMTVLFLFTPFLICQIPLGMQGAACIRVGNALGAGETAAAILTSKVSLISAGKTFDINHSQACHKTKTVICSTGWCHVNTFILFLSCFSNLSRFCSGLDKNSHWLHIHFRWVSHLSHYFKHQKKKKLNFCWHMYTLTNL